MPTLNASTGDALRAVCEAAARTLRCTAHAWSGEGEARLEVRVQADPAAGDGGDAGALRIPFATGALVLERGAGEWSAEERSLAALFAGLAARARGGDPQNHVDPAVLQDPEAYFRAVFHAADAMIWVQDRDTGDFLEANQYACDMQGYSVEEFRALGPGGIAWGEPPFTAQDAVRHMRTAVESGGPHSFEWCARHRDGRPVWAEITLRTTTLNGVDRILATGRRIDDRKAAEDALRRANEALERRVAERTAELAVANAELERRTRELAEANGELERRVAARTAELAVANRSLAASEEHFRRLIENAHDLIVIVDAEGRVRYGSPSVRTVLGYSPEEILGTPVDRLIHREELDAVRGWLRCLREGAAGTHRTEFRIRHADGRWLYLEGVSTAGGAGDGYVVNLRDVTERRRAEEELRRTEEYYRTLIECAHDMITVVAEDGTITFQSQASSTILGYAPEEMMGTSVFDYVHPDDLELAGERFGRVFAQPGVIQRVEYRFRHRDGSWRHLESFGRTVLPDSARAGVVGSVRDITERLQAEAALRESEERFRTLTENAHDIIAILDGATGRITYQSAAMERILGYSPEELSGRSAFELVHPEDLERVSVEIAQALANPGTTRHAEYRYRHRDGSWRYLETFGRTLSADTAEHGLVFNTRDVTERREAELALQRSEEHFRRLIENGSDLLVISAPDGALTYVSPSAERLLGFHPSELVGQTPAALVHPDDVAHVEEEVRRIVAEPGTVRAAAWRVRHRDGSWRLIDARGRTLDPTSPAEGIVVNGRDITEQRAAEEALQRSEEHFRSLTEHSSDVATIAAADGTILYESPAAGRVFGRHPGRDRGQIGWQEMHPEDRPLVEARFAALAAEPDRVQSVRFRYLHADGTWRMLEAVARKMVPTPESPAVINTRDVTDQWHAELALQRSENHFRRLIEHSYDLVQVLDATGHIVYTGPSVQRLLGYTPEEICGGEIPDFMHPDDLPAAGALVAHVLSNPGVSGSLEYRVRHRDGSWRWLEAFAQTLSPTSADEGIVANARDVTERKEAELAVQRSEEHFRRLIENGSDLLMISAPDLALTYVSPSAERLLGYRPADLIGCRPNDLLHPDDACGIEANFRRMEEDRDFVSRATWRIRHRDGTWRLYEALGRVVENQDGVLDFVVNARDITDRVAAEEALRQAKAEAERANHAKSEFLSRMSHELRTPLNSILGFAQVLEEVELEPEYRTGVRHILNGGRHLLKLINEVLDIARIEAEREALSLEPVRLGAVVREAVDMVRPLAAARGVQLAEITSPASERFVHADRQRLAQVLLNLLSNAVKYNRPDGAVQIGCEAAPAADGAERLVVRVADQGTGIRPEQRDQLFVPFARLGAERTGVEGTGLGLALSQRLAQAMGGALGLERTGEEGSVFRVELRPAANPLADVEALLTRAERATAGGRATGTLLYVEDNLANLSLVETILRSRPGWRLIPALQGRLGLELAAEHEPDVILLDLHLPDIPGREVLRHLRADPRTARTPVVVISADATARTMEALRAEGADAFLTKPLDVREFLATVERHLPAPER